MSAYTDTQLQSLKNALASGALEVWFGERKVTYRSVTELKTAIAEVEVNLARQTGVVPVRQILTITSKGY